MPKKRRTDGFTIAFQEHGYQEIRKGDLVIHKMDAFAGAIGVSDSDGKASDKHSKEDEKQVRGCNYTDVYKNDYITDSMELMVATAWNNYKRF